MLTAIIIDDEAKAAKLVASLLDYYCKQVEVLAVTTNSLMGLSLTREKKPDLLFLDIEMPHLNGFELLEKIQDIPVQVIFTTAYDTYAIKAIKFSAADYLLKPIDPADLIQAVGKAEKAKNERLQLTDLNNKLNSVLHAIMEQGVKSENVAGKEIKSIPFGLTTREVEIAKMLVEGQTTSQIAIKLFRSKSTVDKHVQNIYEKLGVSKKSELLNIWKTQN